MNTKTIISVLLAWLIGTTSIVAKEPKHPDSYNYLRGIEALNEGNPQDAMDFFKKELEENPRNGYAYSWIASIYGNNEEHGEALSALNKALRFIPKSDKKFMAATFNMRAGVYTALSDTVKALDDLGSAIRINSEDPAAYESRGQLYYEMGRYDDSDKDYDAIIKIDDGNTTGYMGKARNANSRERYEDALPLLDHVIALAKDFGQAYTFRAESYLGLEKYNEAVDDLIHALEYNDDKAPYIMVSLCDDAFAIMRVKLKVMIKKEPSNFYWPYCLGQLLESKRLYSDAIEQYLAANAIDAHPTLLRRVSSCYEEMGDYDSAILYIDKALSLTPDNLDYKMVKANQLGEAGKIKECLKQWQIVIDEAPDFAWAYYRKGHFEDNFNLTDAAIEDYNMSIVLDPEYAYAYLGRGDMYKRKGEHDKAAQDYQKVVELDTVPNNYSCAMYALLGLGRKDEAINFMERVIASDTTACGNYYDGACFYSRVGDYPKAIEMFGKSLEKGFRRFSHIEKDDDLDAIRDMPEFKALVERYKTETEAAAPTRDDEIVEEVVEIPFTKEFGVTKVKCTINDLPLHFIFDTGASDVTISMVEANFMLKNDYITDTDIIGSRQYMDANGDISVGTLINIKRVSFGGLNLENVRASVVRNQKAPLLLGQSVLGRLGKVEIDNQGMKLKITHSVKK